MIRIFQDVGLPKTCERDTRKKFYIPFFFSQNCWICCQYNKEHLSLTFSYNLKPFRSWLLLVRILWLLNAINLY